MDDGSSLHSKKPSGTSGERIDGPAPGARGPGPWDVWPRYPVWLEDLGLRLLAARSPAPQDTDHRPAGARFLRIGAAVESRSLARRGRQVTLIELVVLAAIVFGLVIFFLSGRRDTDHTHRFPPIIRLLGRWPLKLVGQYSIGGPHGSLKRLEILHDSRFSCVSTSSTGVVDHRSLGYAWSNGEILFLPPSGTERGAGPRAFRTVAWGPRDYLVPEAQLETFCKAVLYGDEPRSEADGKFYLRDDGWAKEVVGVPSLPGPWDAYLQKRLLQGSITDLLEPHQVRLDLGSEDGVEVEMLLFVRGRDRRSRTRLKVLSTDSHSAVAAELNPPSGGPQLRVGEIVVAPRHLH